MQLQHSELAADKLSQFLNSSQSIVMVAKTEAIYNNGTHWIIGSFSAVLTALFILALLKRWLGQRQRRQSHDYDQVSDHLPSRPLEFVSQKVLVDSEDEDEAGTGARAGQRRRRSSSTSKLFSIDDMDSDDDVID